MKPLMPIVVAAGLIAIAAQAAIVEGERDHDTGAESGGLPPASRQPLRIDCWPGPWPWNAGASPPLQAFALPDQPGIVALRRPDGTESRASLRALMQAGCLAETRAMFE